MRPWSPDDLYAASEAVATAVAEPSEPAGQDFVEDFPRDGLKGFLDRLELDERESLYQLVSDELREEIRSELEEENALWLEKGKSVARHLVQALEKKYDAALETVSRQALDLSIAMAEQIVRRSIELDSDALLTALETVIYRTKRGTRFTVLVNPADAEFLRSQPEELERLNIVGIEVDQRIERGGCLVEVDGQEFDYTVSGRLEVMEEAVRQAMLGGAPQEGAPS